MTALLESSAATVSLSPASNAARGGGGVARANFAHTLSGPLSGTKRKSRVGAIGFFTGSSISSTTGAAPLRDKDQNRLERSGPVPSSSENRSQPLDEQLKDLMGLQSDAGWVVSVMKDSSRSFRAKKDDPTFIVYLTTPTSNLTLSRKCSEILELEARLRAQYPDRLPPLKALPSPPSTPKKRHQLLATLSRTLNPTKRSAPPSPTTPRSTLPSSLSPDIDLPAPSSPAPSSLLSLDPKDKDKKHEFDLAELSAYLTKLVSAGTNGSTASSEKDGSWRLHPAVRQFFEIRADDLQSARVERRIKRARSDLTPSSREPSGELLGLGIGVNKDKEMQMGEEMETGEFGWVGKGSEEQVESTRGKNGVDAIGASKISSEELSSSAHSDPLKGIAPPHDPNFHSEPTSFQEPTTPIPSSSQPDPDSSITSSSSQIIVDGLRRQASAITDVTSGDRSSVFEIPSRPTTAEPGDGPGSRRSRIISIPRKGGGRKKERAGNVMTIDDFECMRVLGKGCAGKVLLVRQRQTGSLLALKAIHKNHVLAHRELDHTRTEQSVLKRCASDHSNPFVVRLHYSFHDRDTLYLVLDFHPGGDLATQLARWGRLGRDRARFYAAEIVEGTEGLHRAGVIYRDLKPENILISQQGHIVLTDFGLSKDFGHARIPPSSALVDDDNLTGPRAPHWLAESELARAASGKGPIRSGSMSMGVGASNAGTSWLMGRRETTTTFCGTAEYLAPEVLLGEPYSYEVDAWSMGTMLYEMLSGVTPFYSENHSDMYRKVLHADLVFDDDAQIFDEDTKSLLRGLLQRDPLLRMSDVRIKRHPYFAMIDWSHVYHQRYVPPFIPSLNPLDPEDTSQFDDIFLTMEPQIGGENGDAVSSDRDPPDGEPQAAFDESGRDVFDGYSFYGRDVDSAHEGDDDSLDDERGETDPAGDTVSSVATDLSSPPETDPTSITIDVTRIGTDAAGTRVKLSVLEETPANLGLAGEDDNSDSEWDVIDAQVQGESKNGGKGTTLWSRGVVDRYRLLLSSTPRQTGGGGTTPHLGHPSSSERRGSTSSGPSEDTTSPTPSVSATSPIPELARRKLRHIASIRSTGTGGGSPKKILKQRKSQRSMGVAGKGGEREKEKETGLSSSTESTPRKRESQHPFKRLTLSSFRSPK